MATVAAAALETGGSGGDVQFVMCHQNGLRGHSVEAGHGGNGLARAVHESRGNEQAQVVTCTLNTGCKPEKTGFRLQGGAMLARQCLDEVGTGIVTGSPVVAARVAQSGNHGN